MNRKRTYRFLNRKGNKQGMFPSGKECGYTYLYNSLICNGCLSAYQKSVYIYQKELTLGIKKSRKEEITKFFRKRMYVNRHFIPLAIKYMPDLDVCMSVLSILTVFMEVFPVRMYICIPAFLAWIKGCKPGQDTYLDTGINESIALWNVSKDVMCACKFKLL
jgi:hypothetical protein